MKCVLIFIAISVNKDKTKRTKWSTSEPLPEKTGIAIELEMLSEKNLGKYTLLEIYTRIGIFEKKVFVFNVPSPCNFLKVNN